jgi:hypothetical protein
MSGAYAVPEMPVRVADARRGVGAVDAERIHPDIACSVVFGAERGEWVVSRDALVDRGGAFAVGAVERIKRRGLVLGREPPVGFRSFAFGTTAEQRVKETSHVSLLQP